MTVTYEPPLSHSSAQYGESLTREVIESGPAYARGQRSTRWHRIRSGQRFLREQWQTGEVYVHEAYSTWCGQSMFERPNGKYGVLLFQEEVPTGEPACGTCEGRAIGADPSRPEWLFSPSRLSPPRWCPASRSERLVVELPSRPGMRCPARCLVCGVEARMSAGGSWWSGTWGIKQHEPGPDLIPGCPWHAWRELTLATTENGERVAVCRCQAVERTRP